MMCYEQKYSDFLSIPISINQLINENFLLGKYYKNEKKERNNNRICPAEGNTS